MAVSSVASKGVTFTVTPSSTSNTYSGSITLQVGGLSPGETVTIQKFLDFNSNGFVDAGEYLVQQFHVQDGQGPTLIGGATNINIPYDRSGTDGAITAKVSMSALGLIHRFVGQYLFVVSSPSNHFSAVTNSLLITNPPTGQTISGTVLSNSTPVPYSAVLVGTVQGQDFNPQTGTLSDGAGNYSINVAPGTYNVLPLQTGYVGNPVGPLSIGTSATVSTNLNLVGTATTASGQVVDSSNASIPLPGLLMLAEGNGLSSAATDSNGNFTLSVTTGSQWKIDNDSSAFAVLGYVPSNNKLKTNITGNITGLQFSYPKGDAMFYGQVADSTGQPLAGVRVFGQENNGSGPYQGDATTGSNGQYAMAIVDGNWDVEVDIGSLGPQFAGYIFSQAPFSSNGGGNGTNVAPNTAVHLDFVAIVATNTISGHLLDNNSNAISGVQINGNATINGTPFSAQATTDSSGFYSMNVGSGDWSVNVNCCNGCSNGSLPSTYQCPVNQNVTVANNNKTVNFTVASYNAFLSGRVSDEFGNPIGNMNIFAGQTNGGPSFGGTTDNGGMYQIGLVAGNYVVQLNTDGQTGVASLGLVSPFISITMFDNTSVSNFNVVARHVTGTIVATVTNSDNGQPVSGINVFGSLGFNGTNYSCGLQTTGVNGSTVLQVFNGNWSVGLDCNSLNTQNLSCANNQNANVSSNAVAVHFFVQGISVPPPQFGQASRVGPGQFQFHFFNQPGHNYTLQYATALTNWSTFLITNPTSGDVIILDPNATNSTR
ncbi:MAG: carboxypeptidase regulatory-like domain-containing protein, partial [Limisphaerales bacterium]